MDTGKVHAIADHS